MNAEQLRTRYERDGYLFPLVAINSTEAAGLLRRYRQFSAMLSGSALAGAGEVLKPHLLARWADEAVRLPPVLDAVEAIVGPDIMVWSMDVFVRPPASNSRAGDDRETSRVAPQGLLWHQDAPNNKLNPFSRVVRAWIALTPTTIANGTMRFLRGSNALGEMRHIAVEGLNPDVMGERVDLPVHEGDAVEVTLAAGEFSLHSMTTVHDSGPNHTTRDRVCLSVTYIAPDVDPGDVADSAMLVRGVDVVGNYATESPPTDDLSPEAVANFVRAVSCRAKRYRHIIEP